jgi:broad specificity phosphatase PhoE
MGTIIYLIRHGESEANQRDTFLGHGNLDLTETGREQACVTADYLYSHGPKPDAIYSSDLQRAYHTAEKTAELFDMPVIKEKGLREIDAGLWENVTFSELRTHFTKSFALWSENIGLAGCDGGETVAQLQKRIVSTVTRIAGKHENGIVFLFFHATSIRVFAAHCLGKAPEEIKDVPWPANASVTKVAYDGEKFRMIDYSQDGFMGDLLTKLPENV